MMITKYSINNYNNFVSVLIFLVAIILIAEGGRLKYANAEDDPSWKTFRPGTWCIARPSYGLEALAADIAAYCMSENTPMCPIIEPGGECYQPNTMYNHDSVIYNTRYTPNGDETSCIGGLIVLNDPSYGSCNYPPNEGPPHSLPERKFVSLGALIGNKPFCVPKPGASEQELIANIEYACSQLGDCSIIDAKGACFIPDTAMNHASVVMNMYFASTNRVDSSCNFTNTGVISITDPSYGSCIFD